MVRQFTIGDHEKRNFRPLLVEALRSQQGKAEAPGSPLPPLLSVCGGGGCAGGAFLLNSQSSLSPGYAATRVKGSSFCYFGLFSNLIF